MTAKVLMVFPKFNPNSFWSLREACEMWGARCTAPPLGLITVAALLPPDWTIRLVNRNAEELTDAEIGWADMIMTGGMIPQRADTLALIDWCQRLAKPVVIGGPDVTSSPEAYEHADFRVLGEAEGIVDRFADAWTSGARAGVFEAPRFSVDVTKSPIPRFDLLKRDHYLYIGVQFSRGCPFNCEFCDIIELYGRVPRAKTIEQILAELETLYRSGYRGHVDFVDDNLVGNKKALKQFLPELKRWQRERDYPFRFSTEASMNVADDSQLLRMLSEANFFAMFVGIESPDTDTLISTQKKQNTRRSLADSIHRINGAGIMVIAGFIVGFDSEKRSVAQDMLDCIAATAIPVCIVGLLTALPGTQLTRRLQKESRLRPWVVVDVVDQCTGGLNYETLRPRREVLEDYRTVLARTYAPDFFFRRVRQLGHALRRPKLDRAAAASGVRPSFVSRTLTFLKSHWKQDRALARVMWRMTVRRPDLRSHFWSTFLDCARTNPAALEFVIIMMVMYLHLDPFTRSVVAQVEGRIATECLPDDDATLPLRRAAMA